MCQQPVPLPCSLIPGLFLQFYTQSSLSLFAAFDSLRNERTLDHPDHGTVSRRSPPKITLQNAPAQLRFRTRPSRLSVLPLIPDRRRIDQANQGRIHYPWNGHTLPVTSGSDLEFSLSESHPLYFEPMMMLFLDCPSTSRVRKSRRTLPE